ncbi:ejaculatory bulb-specific protein 3-like [Zootermopsis nevadensis]|uniref:Ejaculatory bulb-specific protein 3 n=1 Tax=Zootermopsis nevadensis TaxID=136037 RepID=A0A067RFL2_ZOONE|nr:ejaculatory bulb-specific protein 3-like [Zootermopsis nevadensis]KDR22552.1 Ejaculatory bulb-specific protein 3 [Zootermopsis nevadensis]
MLYPLTVMVIAGAIQLSASASDTKYTTRYDNIDIDGILKSERLLRSYYNCLLDKGPCTREGLELKKTIPDALLTECSKCSEIQKTQAGVVMAFIQLHHRDMWDGILNKYDPDNTFRKKYLIENDDDDYEDEQNDA